MCRAAHRAGSCPTFELRVSTLMKACRFKAFGSRVEGKASRFKGLGFRVEGKASRFEGSL